MREGGGLGIRKSGVAGGKSWFGCYPGLACGGWVCPAWCLAGEWRGIPVGRSVEARAGAGALAVAPGRSCVCMSWRLPHKARGPVGM